MNGRVPPRIYCIPATKAPVVAVIARGPTNWCHVGRWDLAQRRYEPGAWLGGRIFPRRSDLSPDGRFLCYFTHKPSATWEHGEAYVALSKLPWLTALHAFGTCGTWTRGYYFSDPEDSEAPEAAELPMPYGLRSIPVLQFANEQRHGWAESPDSPQRDPADAWDDRRNARLQKRQPGGNCVLRVESLGWAGGEVGVESGRRRPPCQLFATRGWRHSRVGRFAMGGLGPGRPAPGRDADRTAASAEDRRRWVSDTVRGRSLAVGSERRTCTSMGSAMVTRRS